MKKFRVTLYWDVFGRSEIIKKSTVKAHNRYEALSKVTWGKGYCYSHYNIQEII